MYIWGKISFIVLILFLFINLVPATLPISAYEQNFGYDGLNGIFGLNGHNGTNGSDMQIFAEESRLYLDISGTNGGNGNNGRDGYDALSCFQPFHPDYNLRGANGGNGGSAGIGGRGGNSGSLWVYFKYIDSLSMIRINAKPGKGGSSGRPGRGGRPCTCTTTFWTYKKCTTSYDHNGHPHETCTYNQHFCRDGNYGQTGTSGWKGPDGSMGQVYLINQDEPLDPAQPVIKIKIPQLELSQYTLSDYQWKTEFGTKELFASGSIIRNSYNVYHGRIEKLINFRWESDRSIQNFQGESLQVTLHNEQVKLNIPEHLWGTYSTETNDKETTFVIQELIKDNEVTSLQLTELLYNGNHLTAVIHDNANISNIIRTSLKIFYYAKGTCYYDLKYSGKVPIELIKTSEDKIYIDIGKLPIDPFFLQTGKDVLVRFEATRSFAGKSKIQVFDKVQVIH